MVDVAKIAQYLWDIGPEKNQKHRNALLRPMRFVVHPNREDDLRKILSEVLTHERMTYPYFTGIPIDVSDSVHPDCCEIVFSGGTKEIHAIFSAEPRFQCYFVPRPIQPAIDALVPPAPESTGDLFTNLMQALRAEARKECKWLDDQHREWRESDAVFTKQCREKINAEFEKLFSEVGRLKANEAADAHQIEQLKKQVALLSQPKNRSASKKRPVRKPKKK
jgi:hypothetical protein